MQLEAITVSVGYGDFLRAVAPWNIPHLDRWLIITEPTDLEHDRKSLILRMSKFHH